MISTSAMLRFGLDFLPACVCHRQVLAESLMSDVVGSMEQLFPGFSSAKMHKKELYMLASWYSHSAVLGTTGSFYQ
jgi:hypothetical protein